VAALKVASVGDLKLKVPKGRDGRGVQNNLSLEGCIREGDQVFGEAKSDEFLVFPPYGRTVTLADTEKKLIPVLVQLVQFIFFDVVEVAFFEIF
jgi:hypothetical protein